MSFRLSKQIIDKEGRSISPAGFLQNIRFTLRNVYAPNTGQKYLIIKIEFNVGKSGRLSPTDGWRFQYG